MRTCRVQVNRA